MQWLALGLVAAFFLKYHQSSVERQSNWLLWVFENNPQLYKRLPGAQGASVPYWYSSIPNELPPEEHVSSEVYF